MPVCEQLVSGVRSKLIIDTGNNCSIVGSDTLEQFKHSGIVCESRAESGGMLAYGQVDPLKVRGIFWATVSSLKSSGKFVKDVEFVALENSKL